MLITKRGFLHIRFYVCFTSNNSRFTRLMPKVILFSDVPDSKKFDITLMLTLLRNLTDITNDDDVGFDFIPTAIETTPRADLARIKNYRNNLSHLDEGKVESSYLNIAWNYLTGVRMLFILPGFITHSLTNFKKRNTRLIIPIFIFKYVTLVNVILIHYFINRCVTVKDNDYS